MIVGVDYDTYGASLVGLPFPRPSLSDQPVRQRVAWRKASQSGDAEAISALTIVTTALVTVPSLLQPEEIWIERGYGASRRADWIMGAFFGVLFSACSKVATTRPMTTGQWKKEVSGRAGVTTKTGGRGNATLSKDASHVYVREIAEVARHDLDGFDGNDLDAYAIASVARWLHDDGGPHD